MTPLDTRMESVCGCGWRQVMPVVPAEDRQKGHGRRQRSTKPCRWNSRDVPTENNVSYSQCFLKQREQAGCWVDSWSSPPSWVDPSSGLVQLIAGKAAERQKQFGLSVLPLALPLKVSVWELDNQRQNSRSSRPAESRSPWHYSSSVDLD